MIYQLVLTETFAQDAVSMTQIAEYAEPNYA